MTLFFTIVAALHVVGLYAMLLAVRRAPVAVEDHNGFRVIAEPEEARELAAARVHAA